MLVGYFSNAEEAEIYQEQYCSRCVHYDPDGDRECPVWEAHLAYQAEGYPIKDLLGILIPEAEDGCSNEECRLFYPATRTG